MTPMALSKTPVVLYHYGASPFADKIRNILTLKKIPHTRVEVSYILPRPELSDLLGISYRRIPVLAIGNDVYCDTSLISTTLERRFPASKGFAASGYGTIFPPRNGSCKVDTTIIRAFATYYLEGQLFPPATDHLPYERLPPNFLQDRNQLRGAPIDVSAVAAHREQSKSILSSHLSLLEEQLADGRDWLMDTTSPSLVDISAHFLLIWMPRFSTLRDLVDPKIFPKTGMWLSRMSRFLEEQTSGAPFVDINAAEAARTIVSAESEELSVVGFTEVEACRLGVKQGDTISVTPIDNGRIPTVGKLVALNREEVVIETMGSAGTVRCHFPRFNFSIKLSKTETKL